MPNQRTIPTQTQATVSTFTVISNGVAVSSSNQILSIIVQKEINRIPSATLIIRDGDPASETFSASNSDLFTPGSEIEINAGYRGTDDTIFKGVVVRNSVKIRNQSSSLMVLCKDPVYKMALSPRNRYFRDSKDSDAITDIVDENGFSSEVEETANLYGEIVQFNSTDWDFIMMRTEANGMIGIVEDSKLRILTPDLGQMESLTLLYGATLLEFDAELDARLQYNSVKSVGWKYSDQTIITDESSATATDEPGNISSEDLANVHGISPLLQVHSGNLSESELLAWSNARLFKSKLAKIVGRAKFQGTHEVLPGQVIKLEGVGERFEGKVFVTGIRHEISKGNWTVDAQFGANPEWFAEKYDVQPPKASSLIPSISGLQIGQVTALENDPNGEHRIQLRLPVLDSEDEGIWARVATLDAGNERGSFFLPEIGDEVVVGFLNDDPRHPIVLGALNSSSKPAPIQATDENHEKGFVTRSGIKWLFDDDKNKVLVETPNGNKVSLSDDEGSIFFEDEHGNRIIMDSDGIKLESQAEINLKANRDIKVEGNNISCEALINGKFEANTTTTIKGGIVQIN